MKDKWHATKSTGGGYNVRFGENPASVRVYDNYVNSLWLAQKIAHMLNQEGILLRPPYPTKS